MSALELETEMLEVVQLDPSGPHVVAIGGGHGLAQALVGIQSYASRIDAIVTVADDGGSSGKLRREMGVPPPGDIRNNIAALADDEGLLTRLFQYRFVSGDLAGHAFGNLFIAALAATVQEQSGNQHNSLAEALIEIDTKTQVEIEIELDSRRQISRKIESRNTQIEIERTGVQYGISTEIDVHLQ